MALEEHEYRMLEDARNHSKQALDIVQAMNGKWQDTQDKQNAQENRLSIVETKQDGCPARIVHEEGNKTQRWMAIAATASAIIAGIALVLVIINGSGS